MFGFWQRLRLAWEHARLTAENQRLNQELRARYGEGRIPMAKAEIERLRELQKE